ncbi:hypothetical protein [Nitrosomonas communis]|uniref:hypothetical protein n=1 Tax=Nitrosomonas communis TaxID=44574 RepID=UPI003D288D5B
MKLSDVRSVDDLKAAGSVSELVSKIQDMVHPLLVKAESYDELFEIICCLQKNWLPMAKGPFISKQSEFIYYLTHLEGEQRNNAIGLTDELYDDPELAKRWYKSLSQLVHPDKGGDPVAFDVLRKLYDIIMDVEDDADV